ncbi:MAG: hypothetical protein WB586_06660 [Chthoniobacterales bacterium]
MALREYVGICWNHKFRSAIAHIDVAACVGAWGTRVRFVPPGGLDGLLTVPADYTILQELSIADVYVMKGGLRFQVMDVDSFFQHGIFGPLIRTVPPMALEDVQRTVGLVRFHAAR